MSNRRLILASSSLYRRQILQKLGIEFDWASPDIDETPYPNETPEKLVRRLTESKAHALAKSYPNHLIIGSDQVATLDGKIIGKPGNHPIALAQLESFSNKTVLFLTGLCLLNSATGQAQVTVEDYSVKFQALSTPQLNNYLNKEQPYDCAGSFKSEGLGICLFDKLSGDDPNTLIGLPLIALTKMLIKEGIDPLG
jgi:septum formation protein